MPVQAEVAETLVGLREQRAVGSHDCQRTKRERLEVRPGRSDLPGRGLDLGGSTDDSECVEASRARGEREPRLPLAPTLVAEQLVQLVENSPLASARRARGVARVAP